MFPKYRGGPGAGRGLVLLVLPLLMGTGLLLATGERPEAGTTRLEVTQASISPLPFQGGAPADSVDDPPVVPTLPPAGVAGAEPGVTSTTASTSAASTGQAALVGPPAPGGAPAAPSPQQTASTTRGAPAGEPATTTIPTFAGDSLTTTTITSPAPVARAAEVVTTTTTTSTTSTTTPARTGPVRTPSAEAEVVPLTNRDRSGEGLSSLTRSGCLDSVASRYAEQMARSGVLAHNPGAGAAVIGCQPGAAWGDNVGTSAPCDAALLEREWMASPSHRKNILTGAFRQIGVGAWTDERGGCWVQVLFSS